MKNNSGFTLVEVLVSMTLLMIVGITFFQFFIYSQKCTSENKEKLVAVSLAQSVLEEIKNSKDAYPEIREANVHKNDDINSFDYIQEVNGVTYRIVIEVEKELDPLKGLTLHPVTVKVRCPQGNEVSVKGLVEL